MTPYFENSIFTYSHDKSIHAVADKLVDGAAVDSLVYHMVLEEDPALRAKTRIIWRSPAYGMPPVVANPHLDPALKRGACRTCSLGCITILEVGRYWTHWASTVSRLSMTRYTTRPVKCSRP